MVKLILFLTVLFCVSNYSQVNTERFRKEYDKTGIYGNISLAAGLASGNSEFVKVKGSSRIDYKGNDLNFFLIGNYEFQEANDAKVVNKGFAHLRSVVSLSQIFFLELFLQKEFNHFILLEDRNLAGTGLRTDLIKLFTGSRDSLFEIFLGTGLMFENEKYNIPVSPQTNLFRSTNYLTFKWTITNTVSFITINYFQFDVEKFHDFRFTSDSGIDFVITKNLEFNSSISYRFDNEPVPCVRNFDLELSNGITFSF